MGEWLTVKEAAREAGVDSDTVRRWCDVGKVEARRTPGGHRRVSAESLVAAMTGAPPAALSGPPTAVVPLLADAVDRWLAWVPPHTVSDDQLARLRVELVGYNGDGGLVADLVELADRLAGFLTLRDENDHAMVPKAYEADLWRADTSGVAPDSGGTPVDLDPASSSTELRVETARPSDPEG